jgi:D,D-heptose 1,7-bisphosphate phosphatase
MQALILAGGLGTRLRSVIWDRPKVLAPIGGKNFLWYLIQHLKKNGIVDIILAVGYLAEKIEEVLGDGSGLGLRIQYAREVEPLGTGGAIRNALPLITDEDILVLNGDTFFDIQYKTLRQWHRVWNAGVTIALKSLMSDTRYGIIRLAEDYRIRGYQEKQSFGDQSTYISGGVYQIQRELIASIPVHCSLEYDLLPSWVQQGIVHGIPFGGKFIDIGVPEDYYRACAMLETWSEAVKHRALFLDRDGVIHEDLGHLYRSEDIRFIGSTLRLIQKANASGRKVIVVTNQAGVAKGYYQEKDVQRLHRWIARELRQQGVVIDAFFYCPHHPEGIIEEYRQVCNCRKPLPGLILRAADEWDICLEQSVMIGDQETDRIRLPYLKAIILK